MNNIITTPIPASAKETLKGPDQRDSPKATGQLLLSSPARAYEVQTLTADSTTNTKSAVPALSDITEVSASGTVHSDEKYKNGINTVVQNNQSAPGCVTHPALSRTPVQERLVRPAGEYFEEFSITEDKLKPRPSRSIWMVQVTI